MIKTTKQEKLVQADKLYQKNLRWLEEKYPHIHEILSEKIVTFDALEFDESGDVINVFVDGERLYPQDLQEYITAQMDDKEAVARKAAPMNAFYSPEYCFGLSYAERMFFTNNMISRQSIIGTQSIKHFFDDGLLDYDMMVKHRYHPDFNGSAFLLCFGLGLGHHIDLLFEKYQFANLVIFEKNYDFIQYAAHFHDFSAWEEKCTAKSGKLAFLDSAKMKSQNIEREFAGSIYNSLHYPLFDNNLFFTHIKDVDYRQFNVDFNKASVSLSVGRGFLEDEAQMHHHSMLNIFRTLKNKRPENDKILTKKLVDYQKLPLLLVANGPSLDQSIDIIRQKAEEGYVIMACGSTLVTLLEYDIFPDIFINCENTFVDYWLLNRFTEKYHNDPRWKNIIFIGFQTTSPTLVGIFERAIYVLRSYSINAQDSAFTLFGNEEASKGKWKIDFTTPNVVNLALAVSIPLGFQNIYCLGMDLGTRLGIGHSKKSFYQKHKIDDFQVALPCKRGYEANDMVYQLLRVQSPAFSSAKMRANFGGSAVSNFILDYTSLGIEYLVNRIEKVHIDRYQLYNCSDGRYIENLTPLFPGLIPDLPENLQLLDKEQEKGKLFDKQYNIDIGETERQEIEKRITHNCNVMYEQLDEIRSIINDYRGTNVKEYEDFEKFVSQIMMVFNLKNETSKQKSSEVNMMFVGTIVIYLHHIYKIFMYIDKKNYTVFMNKMLDYVEDLLTQNYQYVEYIFKRNISNLGKYDFVTAQESPISINDNRYFENFVHHLYVTRKKLDVSYPGTLHEGKALPFIVGQR
ncbi:MAG: DUF115 domain-containing protein [Alphaproteobacteria bacterium]|nr:DUF115 domain-containing protein [Alphaproteobacteria bacterium]